MMDEGYEFTEAASFDKRSLNIMAMDAQGERAGGAVRCAPGWNPAVAGSGPLITDPATCNNSNDPSFGIQGCERSCESPKADSSGTAPNYALFGDSKESAQWHYYNAPEAGPELSSSFAIPEYISSLAGSETDYSTNRCISTQHAELHGLDTNTFVGTEGDGDNGPGYINCKEDPLYWSGEEGKDKENNRNYYTMTGCYPFCNEAEYNCIDGRITLSLGEAHNIFPACSERDDRACPDLSDPGCTGRECAYAGCTLDSGQCFPTEEQKKQHLKQWLFNHLRDARSDNEPILPLESSVDDINYINKYYTKSDTSLEDNDQINIEYQFRCSKTPGASGCQVTDSSQCPGHRDGTTRYPNSPYCNGVGTCVENEQGGEPTCEDCGSGFTGNLCEAEIHEACDDDNGEKWGQCDDNCEKSWLHDAVPGGCPYDTSVKKLCTVEDTQRDGSQCTKYMAIKKRFEYGAQPGGSQGMVGPENDWFDQEDCQGGWTNCANTMRGGSGTDSDYHTGCGKVWIYSRDQNNPGRERCKIPDEYLSCTSQSCPAWILASVETQAGDGWLEEHRDGYKMPPQLQLDHGHGSITDIPFAPCYANEDHHNYSGTRRIDWQSRAFGGKDVYDNHGAIFSRWPSLKPGSGNKCTNVPICGGPETEARRALPASTGDLEVGGAGSLGRCQSILNREAVGGLSVDGGGQHRIGDCYGRFEISTRNAGNAGRHGFGGRPNYGYGKSCSASYGQCSINWNRTGVGSWASGNAGGSFVSDRENRRPSKPAKDPPEDTENLGSYCGDDVEGGTNNCNDGFVQDGEDTEAATKLCLFQTPRRPHPGPAPPTDYVEWHG